MEEQLPGEKKTRTKHAPGDRSLWRAVWIPLLAAVIGVACLVVWSFTYTIHQSVSMEGLLFSATQLSSQFVTEDCVVSEVLVQSGDTVEAGDVLAVVTCPSLEDELAVLQLQLEAAEADSAEAERLQQQKDQLETEYVEETIVRAACAGEVERIQSAGDWLEAGETLVTILPVDDYMVLLAFVPLQQVNEIEVGMDVNIYPEFAPREKYGNMGGTVAEVEQTPVTEDRLEELMGTTAYTEGILPDTACALVHIRTWVDSASENGLYWTNENGCTLPVSIGTVCSADVITEEYHPISLLLP